MSEVVALRATWAVGAPAVFWLVGFLTLRILHRRDRVLRSPGSVRRQDDALVALPLAWLFASREVLRAGLGRDPSTLLHLAMAIGGAAALAAGLRAAAPAASLVRRARAAVPGRH